MTQRTLKILINLVENELSKETGMTDESAKRRIHLGATLRSLQEMRLRPSWSVHADQAAA